jgi:hypothetical protein
MNFRFEKDTADEPMSAGKTILYVLGYSLVVGIACIGVTILGEYQPKKFDHNAACKAMGMKYQPYEEVPGYDLCYGVGPDGKLEYRDPFPGDKK